MGADVVYLMPGEAAPFRESLSTSVISGNIFALLYNSLSLLGERVGIIA